MKSKQIDDEPKIKAAPTIRQVYWCKYPPKEHTYLKEFFMNEDEDHPRPRPVVVLSRKSDLYGVVTVVPMTHKTQDDYKYSIKLRLPDADKDSWVICNHVHTMSVRRLMLPYPGRIRKIPNCDFQNIVRKVYQCNLPYPPEDFIHSWARRYGLLDG